MKRFILPVISGVVLYVVFLIATLPASLLVKQLPLQQSSVELKGVSGTVWNGQAQLRDARRNQPVTQLGTLKWELHPLSLFLGRAHASLSLVNRAGELTAEFYRSLSSYTLVEGNGLAPAELIGVLYPPASLLGATGEIHLQSKGLALAPGAIEGQALITWKNAGAALLDTRELGTYTLKLTGQKKSLAIAASSSSRELNLNASGSWSPFDTGQLQVNGRATPNPASDKLAPLLRMMGGRPGSGAVPININTVIKLP